MTCECGRESATGEDVERWFDETDRDVRGEIMSYSPGLGCDGRPVPMHADFAPEIPAWAFVLCWTRAGAPCKRDRKWASERWIGAARMSFRFFVDYGVRLTTPDPVPSDGYL